MSHQALISKRKRGGGRGRLLNSGRLQTPEPIPSLNPRYEEKAKRPTVFQQLLGRGPYMEAMRKERRKISKEYEQVLKQQRKQNLREERKFKEEIKKLRQQDKLGAGWMKLDQTKRSYLKDLEEQREKLKRYYGLNKKEAKNLSPREKELRQKKFKESFRKRELAILNQNKWSNKAKEKSVWKQRDLAVKEMRKNLREQTIDKSSGGIATQKTDLGPGGLTG